MKDYPQVQLQRSFKKRLPKWDFVFRSLNKKQKKVKTKTETEILKILFAIPTPKPKPKVKG